MSVLASNCNALNQFNPKRKKVRLFDLRSHNIDYLRYTHDWSKLLLCTDIQVVYDMFLCEVHKLINEHMPDMMIKFSSLNHSITVTTNNVVSGNNSIT